MSIYCGREFSPDDIQTIKYLMEQNPGLKRTPLSRKLCELFDWTKPNGELKDMTCRVALLRMQADGLITLPLLGLHAHVGQPDALQRLRRRSTRGAAELRRECMETRRARALHRLART